MIFSFLNNLIFLILLNILGIFLILWVYFSNSKEKVNQFFLLMMSPIILWTNFNYLSNTINSIIFKKLNLATVCVFFIFVYFFSIYFPRLSAKRYRFIEKAIIVNWILIAIIIIFTNFIISDLRIESGLPRFIFGPGSFIFYPIVVFFTLFILFLLFQKYFTLPKELKLKVQYFLIGVVLFAIFNIIFNVIFPVIRGMTLYYQLGDYSAIFLLGFTAYAIIKRELFGIKVVLTILLVGLIAILLFANFLTSQTGFEYFWKGAILGAFALFGWLLIKSVVKEIKQRERIDQYAKDLSTANESLQKAYGKLELLDKAKSEFVSIASHQLRTPLTAIKGYISMMIEGDYGKISKGALQSMKNVYLANERLVKLVNSLLDMSRLEAGRITLEFTSVKIDELIAGILRELRQEAENKKLKLRMVKDRIKLPKIEADPTKLRDSLMNLVDNAIKYTNKGEIAVKIKYNSFEGNMEITVQDTGEGMTQEEIDKLFQSFSRTDSGRKNWSEGSGLGLYIAKKFIEMHHGKIHAESPGKGQGSRFIIELPISQPSQPKPN